MNRFALGFVGGMVLLLGAAFGSEEAPVPPTPLYRPLVPEKVVGKVSITRPALERLAKAGKLPTGLPGLEKEREITPGDKITRVVQKFTDGASLTAYFTGGMALVENAKGNPEIHKPKGETWELDFSETSFPELAWITETNYKGIEKRGEQEFHCYEGNDAHSRPQRLFVYTQNLMPALFESEAGRYVYSYRAGSGETIALPPKLTEAWQIYRKSMGLQP
jgi:hypothetical protein